MSERLPSREHDHAERRGRPEESLLRGGLTGIALVTAATVGVAGVAAVIALVVALLYG